MAALSTSVAPSLASEYAPNRAWLTQDANPTGKGPVTTGPVEPISDPRNATAPVELATSPLDWTEPELTEQAPDYFAESAFPHAGPVAGPPGKVRRQGAVRHAGAGWHRADRVLQGPREGSPGSRTLTRCCRATTGTARMSTRPGGSSTPRRGGPPCGRAGSSITPASTTGGPSPSRTSPGPGRRWAPTRRSTATVAQYGDLASSGGSTAYEPPAPPAVTTQQPAAAGAGTIPQWGF